VLIAFFGGLALIIARTKKGTIASVIFGVAIATALMPPLCTAGYGLAVWFSGITAFELEGWEIFLGAMNLFTINTIFIALATFVVLKVLRFPMLKYANSKRRRLISRVATLLAIVVMIPAVWTFWNVIQESKFNNQINRYLEKEIKKINGLQLFDSDIDYDSQILELSFFNEVPESTRQVLLNRLRDDSTYPDLQNVQLRIKGSDTKSYELISDLYKDTRDELKTSRTIMSRLQKEIEELESEISILNQQLENQNISDNKVSFSGLAKEIKIRFNDLEYFSYAKMLESKDFIKVDTIDVAVVKWNTTLNDSIMNIKEQELSDWLKQEIQIDTVVMRRH
ncbi:MAG: DUF389 domain-containing protein, partial [Psychroserpens sp.]|nr:DUF389 domain-containing protein [Psychroserpens sp.]